MERVTCPHCGRQTYRAPHCGYCLKPLTPAAPQQEAVEAVAMIKGHIDRIKDEYGFRKRAEDQAKNHQRIIIARFEARPRSGASDVTGELEVEENTRKFIVSSHMREPIRLEPGRYSVADLLLRDRSSGRAQFWVCECTVDQQPRPATYVLPDEFYLDQNADVDQAIESLALRTSDEQHGGAELQMSLECEDPVKLLNTFGDDFFGGIRHGDEANQHQNLQIQEFRRTPPQPEKPRLFTRAWFRGLLEGAEAPPPPKSEFHVWVENFTIADLYPRLRMELTHAISSSIRKMKAVDLYDNSEKREEVQRDIRDHMRDTLETLGLRIHSVSAFRFRSPAYERLLAERGERAIERERVSDDRQAVEIRKAGRSILRDDLVDAETNDARIATEVEDARQQAARKIKKLEGETARTKVAEDQATARSEATERGTTKKVQDTIAAEEQTRRLEQEAARRDAERKQRDQDERLELLLTKDRALQALEIHNQLHLAEYNRQKQAVNDEHQRELERIKAYSEVPPDKLLEIAMINHPHVKDAYVALKQAVGREEQIRSIEGFHRKVEEIYGKNSQNAQVLLLEVARQAGFVAGKALESRRPPPVDREDEARAGRWNTVLDVEDVSAPSLPPRGEAEP